MVGSTSKPNRKGPASHIGKDPKDRDKIPIDPGDVITSVNRAANCEPVVVAIKRRFLNLFVQPHEHDSQQGVRHVLAVRDFLADGLRLAQQFFGLRHFHDLTVGRAAGGEYVQGVPA